MNFTDKTALVTGAAVGIGRAVALKLAQEGASLVLVDVNAETLSGLKDELKNYSDNVMTCECDVTDENTVYEIIAKAEKVFGKIDILVNNAALWRCWSLFVDTPTDEWKKFIDVNIMGVVYFTKAVLPKMIENGYG